ncbi:hypothetical protein MMC25_000804 [Agyrium rufum]|nr:hypothetical protein [Agyrium rufum]
MRSSVFSAALFAVGALSSPINKNKREIVTDVIVKTVTDFVYVGAGGAITVAAPMPQDIVSQAPQQYPHPHPHPHPSSAPAPVEPSSTPVASSAPAPAPSSPAPAPVSSQAPAPPASSAAPAPSSPAPAPTSVAPAPAPPASSAAPPPPASTVASSGSSTTINNNLSVNDAEYAQLSVDHHNVHRSNHSAPSVEWNSTLATWAQNKAESCVWDETMPSGVSGVGMNIAQGTNLNAGMIPSVISNMWYDDEVSFFPGYGLNDLDTSEAAGFNNWGHFSQVVWKGSQSIGCGTAACGTGTSIGSGYFVACMYYPPGNYEGDFTQVGKAGNAPTVAVVGNKIVGM